MKSLSSYFPRVVPNLKDFHSEHKDFNEIWEIYVPSLGLTTTLTLQKFIKGLSIVKGLGIYFIALYYEQHI